MDLSSFLFQPYDWEDRDMSTYYRWNEESSATVDLSTIPPPEIHAWCLTPGKDGKRVLVRIRGFRNYFYFRFPDEYQDDQQGQENLIAAMLGVYYHETKRSKALLYNCRVRRVKAPLYNFYRGQTSEWYAKVECPDRSSLQRIVRFMELGPKVLDRSGPMTSYPPFQVFENKVSILRKFLTTVDLEMTQWFRLSSEIVPLEKEKQISTSDLEFLVDYTQIVPIPSTETGSLSTELRVLSFDIEVYSNDHDKFPRGHFYRDKVFIITAIFQVSGRPETRKNYAIVYGETDSVSSCDELTTVNDSRKIYPWFWELVGKTDPEVITGYNVFGFDFRYMNEQMSLYGMMSGLRNGEWPVVLSRLKPGPLVSQPYYSGQQATQGGRPINVGYPKIPGRIVFDLYPYVVKNYKLTTYDLNTVSNFFLNRGKHDVKPKEMFEVYATSRIIFGDPELDEISMTVKKNIVPTLPSDETERKALAKTKMARVLAYGIEDSILVIDLFEKLGVGSALIQMSSVLGVVPNDLFTRGQQVRCYSQIYNLAKKRGYIIDSRPGGGGFSGGFVQDPTPGLFDMAGFLDFNSLYPTIIMAYNICHTTLISTHEPEEKWVKNKDCNIIEFDDDAMGGEEEEDPDEENDIPDPDAPIVKKEDKKTRERGVVHDETKTKHCRYLFVKKEVREGVLPELVRKLVTERKAIKNRLEGTNTIPKETDPAVRKILDSRQNALKIAANSMYGFLNPRTGGMLPLPEGAACITAIGRQSIQKVNNYVMDKGGQIIYNDTDSCVVSFGHTDAKEAEQRFHELAVEVSQLFPKPMNMEFEKLTRILIFGKKMYAYMLYKKGVLEENLSKIMARGIVLARRDKCPLVQKTYQEILHNILRLGNVEETFKILLRTTKRLLKGEIPLTDLRIVKTMGDNYKSSSYPLAIYSNFLMQVGQPVDVGSRVEFVVAAIPNTKYAGQRWRPYEWYLRGEQRPGEPIDYVHYLSHELANPIDTLISVGHGKDLQFVGIGYLAPGCRKYLSVHTPLAMISRMLEYGEKFREDYSDLEGLVLSMIKDRSYEQKIQLVVV